MFEGLDLVFLMRLAASAAAVVLVGPVVRVLLLRKWRRSLARREEIDRLLVLASEEAARAEFEAAADFSSGYSYGYGSVLAEAAPTSADVSAAAPPPVQVTRKLLYQCALCFSPASPRCSQCKSVRYCSGKCQIIHWRQGHKDACHPVFNSSRENNSDETYHSRVFKQSASRYANVTGDEDTLPPLVSAEPILSKSSMPGVSANSSGMDAMEGNHLNNERTSTSDSEFSCSSFSTSATSSKSFSSTSVSDSDDSVQTRTCQPSIDKHKRTSLEQPNQISSVNPSSASRRFSHIKPGAEDIKSISSGSRKSSVDGNTKYSSAEPYSSSSAFWEGVAYYSKFKMHVEKDVSHPISKEAHGNVMLKVNGLPKESNCGIEGKNNVSDAPKALKVDCPPAKAYCGCPSNIGNCEFRSIKSTKDDNTEQITGRSLEYENHSQNSKKASKFSGLKVMDQLKIFKLPCNSSTGVRSEIGGRYNSKDIFSYELFVELYNWSKVELHPFGLLNCGNSCYANAVLQCLTFTPPFTAYFLQGLHSKRCRKTEWCFTCELVSLVLEAKEGNSPLSPMRILSHLENIGSTLCKGKEEDAHEFLRHAIDAMQSVCLKEVGITASRSSEVETTLVGLTFGGYLCSKVECMRCGGKFEKHERMMDVTVEIQGDVATLEEALKQFTRSEILDGENKYLCSRCKSYEKAKKKMKVMEAPNVLTIALKRFQSGKSGKLNKRVTFPEILNLASYMSGTSDKSPIYRLYAVIVHLDVMNAAYSGHYICYVKNFQNKWFRVDDSTVKNVKLQNVLSERAYILLYARCSPRAPRFLKSSSVVHDARRAEHPNCESRTHTSSQDIPYQTTFDDYLSDNSSSLFSEAGTSSTDNSHSDSASIDNYLEMSGDLGGYSDTSSSSFSSPLYSRHLSHAAMDHYAPVYPETRGYPSTNADSHGFWAGQG